MRQDEQPDKLRKTAQLGPELASPTSSASSTHMPLEYFPSGEGHVPSESVIVRRSHQSDNDVQISSLDVTLTMGGKTSLVHHISVGMVQTRGRRGSWSKHTQ